MVDLRQRSAEDRHDGIPHELHHGAALRQDGAVHFGAMLVELARQDRGIRILRDRGVATDIRHQHRDHQGLGLPDPAAFATQLFGDPGWQQPAEALALLLAVDDRLVQQLEAAQGAGRPAAGRLGQLEEQPLQRRIDIGRRRPADDGNRLDGLAFRQHLEELFLIRSEIGPQAGGSHQRLDDPGIEHRAAGRHLADGSKQLIAVRHPVLQQVGVAGRAFTQQGDGVIRLVVLGEHDDTGARVALSNLLRRFDPLPLEGRRHPDIGDDHLRRRPLRAGHEFVVVAGDANHLHVGRGADQGPNALPHDQVVVGQEYGNLLGGHPPI